MKNMAFRFRSYIKRSLPKALSDSLVRRDIYKVLDNDIYKNGKNILIIMPFWENGGTAVYFEQICESLKKLGYILHVLIYNKDNGHSKCDLWDYSYKIRTTNRYFGKWKLPNRKGLDSNLVDDWVADDLLMYVGILQGICNFSACICNYIYLSKALTMLPSTTTKILIAHDVLTKRNSRMEALGINGRYFSVQQEEESKGLNRADVIFAIQDDERKYFESICEKKVYILPYIPEKSVKLKTLRIGYIASAHSPNILAINKFIDLIKDEYRITLYIAGHISNVLEDTERKNVVLLGAIDDLERFYCSYDLYINPDELFSGSKIKTVEAFAHTRPLVCTESASAGLPVSYPWHKAKNVEECVRYVLSCIDNPELLETMSQESERVYDDFAKRYSSYDIFLELLGSVNVEQQYSQNVVNQKLKDNKVMKKTNKKGLKFIQKVFSITRNKDRQKILTILGISIHLKEKVL